MKNSKITIKNVKKKLWNTKKNAEVVSLAGGAGLIPGWGKNFFVCFKVFFIFFMAFLEFVKFFKIFFPSFLNFSMNVSNFQTKKFSLAREPFNSEKIWISEGTRQKIQIGEHFELLDFELVSLDCTWFFSCKLSARHYMRL